MKKIKNSYKKSGVNISLANKLVKHISKLSQKKCQKNEKLTIKMKLEVLVQLFDISKYKN